MGPSLGETWRKAWQKRAVAAVAPDEVREEADELASLERVCGVKLSNEILVLQSYADGLSDGSDDRETGDPESKYISKPSPNPELDVDFLFSGLLDR
jgi:hypothetical protein